MMSQLLRKSEIRLRSRPDNLCAWLSAVILGLALLSPVVSEDFIFDDVTAALLFSGMFGIAMLWVAMTDAPYSLRQVHWVFYVTFFAIAPLIQYVNSSWPWGYNPSHSQVLNVCFLVIAWGVLFAIASGRTKSVSQDRDVENRGWLREKLTFTLTPIARTLLPVGSLLCVLVLIRLIGLSNLFLRTTNSVELDSSSLAISLAVCLRAFVFGSFALLALNARRERRYYGGVFVAGTCLLLTCFPTALARFNIAAIYLGLAILFMPSFSTKRGLFTLMLILGFLVAYPLFNAFKYIGSTDSLSETVDLIVGSMTAGFSSGNYDAFSVMFWCFDYVSLYGTANGGQLIGACLFFIPRSLWPDKPVPSGELVFGSLNFHFTDIAFPLPFEGYLNFGIVGLLLFAVLYGAIVRKLDERYWDSRMNNAGKEPTTLLLYYPFLLSLTFYMLRGAMMTTFTYVFGDLAVMFALHLIARSLARHEMANPR